MNPFTALKNFSPLHFTFYFIYLFFSLILSTIHFTSLHFPSPFTFCRLHLPSLVFTFLTLFIIHFLLIEFSAIEHGHLRELQASQTYPACFMQSYVGLNGKNVHIGVYNYIQLLIVSVYKYIQFKIIYNCRQIPICTFLPFTYECFRYSL